jgi:ketosteroid isomerase-like protein
MTSKLLALSILFAFLAVSQVGEASRKTAELAADLEAIRRLHERDAAAAKIGDVKTLVGLWTLDGVAMPPGEPPVKGIDALQKWLEKSNEASGKFDITKFTKYVMDFEEVKVFGDEAVEWGRTSITAKPKGAPFGLSASGNLMRILRRQPDGDWKVARAIWNLEKPAPQKPSGQQ